MRPLFNGKKVARFLFPLVLFQIFAIAGCGTKELPKVGEQAKSEQQIGVTINNVKIYDEYTLPVVMGNGQKPAGDNNLFVFANATVENLGTEAKETSVFTIFDSSGNEYFSQLTVIPPPETAILDIGKPVDPGGKVEGTLMFIIPEGTVLDRVAYQSQPVVEMSLDSLTASMPPPQPLPRMGQPATGGGVEMIVYSISTPAVLEDKYLTTSPPPGGKLVVIDVSLKNISIQPKHTVNPLEYYLIDANDKLIRGGELAWGMPLAEKLPMTGLTPGSAARGKIVFTVLAATVIKGVYYDIAVLGPPVEVDVT